MFSALRLVDLNYLESVKPTLQRQGHVGLLLNIKQTFALLTDGRLKSTQSGRPKKSHPKVVLLSPPANDNLGIEFKD